MVADDTDSYRFAGELTAISLGSDGTVTVDGETIDPSNYGSTTLPNKVIIDSSGFSDPAPYAIEVTGETISTRSATATTSPRSTWTGQQW